MKKNPSANADADRMMTTKMTMRIDNRAGSVTEVHHFWKWVIMNRIAIVVASFVITFTLLAAPSPALAQEEKPRLPILFLVGDSTVKTPTKGQQGWGDRIGVFFDPGKITVENHAIGGR